MDEKKIIAEAQELLDNHGISLHQLIELTGRHNSSLLQMSDLGYRKYCLAYEKLQDVALDRQEKGQVLESLVSTLIKDGYCKILECRNNCRTSSNEIDLQVNWTESARLANIPKSFQCFGDSFLCECKNYSGKVDVTYVGKFYSLLKVTDTKLGILFSQDSITGRGPWSDAKGLIKKIALRDNTYIIDIGKEGLEKIYKKEINFFSLVYDKYLALKMDIDYSKYISKHESEQYLLNKDTNSVNNK